MVNRPFLSDQEIIRYVAIGKTAKQIARHFKIPPTKVYDTLQKYNLSARKLRKQLREERRNPPNLKET